MIFREWGRIVRMYERAMEELIGAAPTAEQLERLNTDPQLGQRATEIALRVIRAVAQANGQSWRRAANKSRRARRIYDLLQSELADAGVQQEFRSLLTRNAELIRSLPAELANWATSYVARQQQRGRRAKAIEQELSAKLPQLAASRVRLIARTEVSKAETAITRVRSERIGAHWYQWVTSKDKRVRPSHRNLDGVVVAWSDPPAPEQLIGEQSSLGHYHAGEAPNCRCICLPVISLDEIHWPARCYLNGVIRRLSRAEFVNAFGIPLAA
jgi:SPP1 gp7 family putative phage head morphogenesis protein